MIVSPHDAREIFTTQVGKKNFSKKNSSAWKKNNLRNQQKCSCIDETKAYIFAVNPRAVRDKSM